MLYASPHTNGVTVACEPPYDTVVKGRSMAAARSAPAAPSDQRRTSFVCALSPGQR